MRFALAVAAAALFAVTPAEAAPYVTLQIDASGPGLMLTVDCAMGDPLSGCIVHTPGEYSDSRRITVEDWVGSTDFSLSGPGYYEFFSGTLTKVAGGSIVGTNYNYVIDNGKACRGQQICLNYRHDGASPRRSGSHRSTQRLFPSPRLGPC